MEINVTPKQLNYILISLRRYGKELAGRDEVEFGDDYEDLLAIEHIIEILEKVQKENISAV